MLLLPPPQRLHTGWVKTHTHTYTRVLTQAYRHNTQIHKNIHTCTHRHTHNHTHLLHHPDVDAVALNDTTAINDLEAPRIDFASKDLVGSPEGLQQTQIIHVCGRKTQLT